METAREILQGEKGDLPLKQWYRWVYLKSLHWFRLRKRKLEQMPSCEKCRVAPAQQVHHINYRSIYDVQLSDLQSVCNRCHCRMHGREYNEPKPYWRDALKKPIPITKRVARAFRQEEKAKRKRNRQLPKRGTMSAEQLRAFAHLMERGRL